MSIYSVSPRSFILALFIRDDDERFLLGDNGYDFKDSQLHFAANSIENDEVAKQGADGVMLAGQVRRSNVQKFEGYVGDGATPKETIESMRRDFIAFFAKGHHFRVVYVDCNRNAWQRKGGYLVDAPEVQELWQIHPEYSVGLNFEDVNYYSYDENSDGEEILSNIVDVPVSVDVDGGLVWDEDGAESETATVEWDTESTDVSGKTININSAIMAPLESVQIDGETSQNGTPTPSAPVAVQAATGENVVKICGKNLFDKDNANILEAYIDSQHAIITGNNYNRIVWVKCAPNTTYTVQRISPPSWYRGVAWTEAEPAVGVQTYGYVESNSSSITITTGSTAKYLVFRCYQGNGDASITLDDVLNSIQIEVGATATAYEAYKGQNFEINLGKNLFDKANANVLNAYIDLTSKILTSNSINWTVWIPVSPNTTYTISVMASNWTREMAWTEAEPAVGVQTYGMVPLYGGQTSISLTTGATANYIVVRLWHNNNSSETWQQALDNLQIEKGSTATTYASYFTPIELCKIGNYQDYIYKNEGKWYVHKEVGKYTFNDASIFTWGSDRNRLYIGESALNNLGVDYVWPAWGGTDLQAFSDKFTATNFTYGYNASTTSGSWCMVSNTGTLSFRNAGVWTDSITARSDLTGTNFYYIHATPTDTEITNSELIEQLDALAEKSLIYQGTNNILAITANEIPTLEIGYYTKYEFNITDGGYVWDQGGQGGPTTVINESISNVSPVWTVHGPVQNPILENTTTGEQIEYVGTIAEGQTLVVDMGEQTAELNGLNVLANITGDFVSLAPGKNVLLYVVDDDGDPSQLGWSEIVG